MHLRPALITPIACTLLLAACGQTYQVTYPLPTSSSSASSQHSRVTSNESPAYASELRTGRRVTSSSTSPAPQSSSVPASVLIDVPFATQAPLANWDALHEEACEEASLILVQHYLNGQMITPQEMEDAIQSLITWETSHGYGKDVTIAQLSEVAKQVYGLNGTVIADVSVARIKKEIAAGHPIIIPAAGRMLGNPNFSGLGPPYHMLVITGYDSTNFITNDVGTKRGKDYRYSYDTIINAIHDWKGSNDTIESGAKRMLVLGK